MADVHTHLLPGVDDGFPTAEASLEALRRLAAMGVSSVCLTPHVMAERPENTAEHLRAAFEAFRPHAEETGIHLRLGAEYMLDEAFHTHRHDAGGLLVLGGRHLLIETSPLAPAEGLRETTYELMLDGYRPILAHPERYAWLDLSGCQRIKAHGCQLQLNLFSLAGAYGQQAARMATLYLKEGLYDFTGSDIHELSAYERSLTHLAPSAAQTHELTRLIANNHTLLG
jgi:tyrosine-protein phosphatase YwqE